MLAAEQRRYCCLRSTTRGRRTERGAGAWRRVALVAALVSSSCGARGLISERDLSLPIGWTDLGGSTPYAYGASSPGLARLDLWAVTNDGRLYVQPGVESAWQLAGALPEHARIAGSPAAVFRGKDTTDVLVRDTNGSLWTSSWTNTSKPSAATWTGWTTAGASSVQTAFDPALTALPNQDRIDLWAITADGAVAHVSRAAGAWSGAWTSIGAPLGRVAIGLGAVARPGVAAAIDLVVSTSDRTVWHGRWDDARGTVTWEAIGAGARDGHPSISASSASRLTVWIKGTDNAIYDRTWDEDTGAWTPARDWSYVGAPPSGATSGPTALSRGADPQGGIDVVVRGGALEAEHKVWHDNVPTDSSAPTADPPASLTLLEKDGVSAAPLWEAVALAVPPAAACPNGKLIIAGSREVVAPGNGTARVWTADLGAVAAGGHVAMPQVALPSTGDPGDYFNESDDAIALMADGTVLLDLHAGHSDGSPSPPFTNPRGVELLYTSSDCGAHWELDGRIDPASPAYANGLYSSPGAWGSLWPSSGNDRPELYVDPWSDPSGRLRVYVTADACGQATPGVPPKSAPTVVSELLFYGLWDPRSRTFVPQPCSAPNTPFCLLTAGTPAVSPMPFAPDTAMTSLPGGALYLFSCQGSDAVLHSFDPGAVHPTLSREMVINPGGVDSLKCAKLASSRSLEGSLSISRVGSYSEGDMVRVTWPGVEGSDTTAKHQILNVAYVVVSGDRFTIASSTQISSGRGSGSILQAAVAEMAVAASTLPGAYGVTSPPQDITNTTLLYYYSTSASSPDGDDGDGWGRSRPTMVLLRNENLSSFSSLGTDFPGFRLPGDYQHGSAYFDATNGKLTGVALWTDTSAVVLHANVITSDP